MIRRLFYDLEVSPNIALVWRTGFKKTITPESIIEERKIISVAWKWQGKSKVHALTWDRNKDDKTLLKEFVPVLESSDEAVAYFGDSFDFPWVRGRCLIQRVKIRPEIKTVDPILWVKKLNLNSNKMDYVSQLFGVGKKPTTGFQLWKDIVLDNCPASLRKMVSYNKNDVVMLEGVYDYVSKLFPAKTHVGVLAGNERWSCAKCASTKVKTDTRRISASGAIKMGMQCLSCGGYYTISEASHKKYQER